MLPNTEKSIWEKKAYPLFLIEAIVAMIRNGEGADGQAPIYIGIDKKQKRDYRSQWNTLAQW